MLDPPTMEATGIVAEYTRDPKKIAILKRNAIAGELRERLEPSMRADLDRQAMNVDTYHIRKLRVALGLDIKK